MLLNMHIKNIALIDEIDINFSEGLNILTGETGAGKSIIIGSLGIGLGGKFPKDMLRDDSVDGVVELLFSVDNDEIKDKLIDIDINPGDDMELLISRRLGSSGKTINRINDCTVTTAKLRQVSEIMIDLHAQHDQQTLLKRNKHLEILDHFGKSEIRNLKNEVRLLFKEYSDLLDELSRMDMPEDKKNQEMDYLLYRINEIEAANLKQGEDSELEAIYKKAQNSREIIDLADEAYKFTGYDLSTSAGEMISHAVVNMKKISELDSDAKSSYSLISDIDGMLNDFNRELSEYMKSMEFDAEEFKELEERLNLINSMKAKYGNSIEQIFIKCDELKEEYDKLVLYDENLSKLKSNIEDKKIKLTKACENLRKARKKYAKTLCDMIKESLSELNFMEVKFGMEFEELDHFTANGMDEAYFMISTNVGEPQKPLYDVASGGELSRVMLALKSCLADEEADKTLVFDEIDVGISGITAQKVGEKMQLISKNHQLICITHLPQIAAMANAHYLIEKIVVDNKTISNIRKLNEEDSILEIARILGGEAITDAVMLSAKQMKESAQTSI